LFIAHCLLLAQEQSQTILEKLEPERRVAVVLALVALGLLGVLLVIITMLASRWARHDRPGRTERLSGKLPDTGQNSSSADSQTPDAAPAESRGDTIADRPNSDETQT